MSVQKKNVHEVESRNYVYLDSRGYTVGGHTAQRNTSEIKYSSII